MTDALLSAILPLTLLLLVCILFELIAPKQEYSLRSRWPGAFFIILFPAVGVLASYPLMLLLRAIGFPSLVNLSSLPSIWVCIFLVLARDFLNYWQHRFDHRVMWPIHSAHHSVTELHAANGYAHPLQLISEFLFIAIPLSLVDTGGVQPPMFVAWILAFQAMIIHSPLRFHLGPLNRILIDSRFHRIHHSLEEKHFDKNFGTVFSLWDQLFGTAYFPGPQEWPDTGVEGLTRRRTSGRWWLIPCNSCVPRAGRVS